MMIPDSSNQDGSKPSLSIDDLQRELTALENGSFAALNDEELREKIRLIHDGFILSAPILPPGSAIYRAVKVQERPRHIARVSYPPKDVVKKYGRLNRPNEPMFYGAFHSMFCLQECSWQIGEFFAVSGWLTTQQMTFNHLGFSQEVLEGVKTRRDLPSFATISEETHRNFLIRSWQARVFTKLVATGDESLYRLPVALKDIALSKMVQNQPTLPDIFSGVLYPSVASWLLGDNVAVLPSEVDAKLALFEVALLTLDSVKVDRKDDGSIHTHQNLKTYDYARADAGGNLVWGQESQIVYPPGTDASKIQPRLLAPDENR